MGNCSYHDNRRMLEKTQTHLVPLWIHSTDGELLDCVVEVHAFIRAPDFTYE